MRKHDMRHNRPAGGGRPLARGPLTKKSVVYTAPLPHLSVYLVVRGEIIE